MLPFVKAECLRCRLLGYPGESQNPSSVPLIDEGKRGETSLSILRNILCQSQLVQPILHNIRKKFQSL